MSEQYLRPLRESTDLHDVNLQGPRCKKQRQGSARISGIVAGINNRVVLQNRHLQHCAAKCLNR
jgi:hypothetical protein